VHEITDMAIISYLKSAMLIHKSHAID